MWAWAIQECRQPTYCACRLSHLHTRAHAYVRSHAPLMCTRVQGPSLESRQPNHGNTHAGAHMHVCLCQYEHVHTHPCTHARKHARTHARTCVHVGALRGVPARPLLHALGQPWIRGLRGGRDWLQQLRQHPAGLDLPVPARGCFCDQLSWSGCCGASLSAHAVLTECIHGLHIGVLQCLIVCTCGTDCLHMRY